MSRKNPQTSRYLITSGVRAWPFKLPELHRGRRRPWRRPRWPSSAPWICSSSASASPTRRAPGPRCWSSTPRRHLDQIRAGVQIDIPSPSPTPFLCSPSSGCRAHRGRTARTWPPSCCAPTRPRTPAAPSPSGSYSPPAPRQPPRGPGGVKRKGESWIPERKEKESTESCSVAVSDRAAYCV